MMSGFSDKFLVLSAKFWVLGRFWLGVVLVGSFGIEDACGQSADANIRFVDSLRVETRDIAAEKLDAFRSDDDFDYGTYARPTLTLWQRIKYWIAQQIDRLFNNTYFGRIYEIILYAVCLLIIVLVIIKLSGVSVRQLFFGRNDRGLVSADGLEDNIHAVNFEEEIAQALKAQNYRWAVRLQYVFALKKLTDQQMIRWQPGKTNHDYQQEMRGTPLETAFNQLSYYYEYAWYGNFPVDEALYQRVEDLSQSMNQAQRASV